MSGPGDLHGSAGRPRPLAWVVPGPLRQLTGGYLYDARIVDGLRARGRAVGVLDVRARRWPLDLAAGRRLIAGLRREHWATVVVDELAHPALLAALAVGGLRRVMGGAPLILLVHHLRCSEAGAGPLTALARVAERICVRAADLVACTSTTTAASVRGLGGSSVAVEVIRPGWDTHDRRLAAWSDRSVPSTAADRDRLRVLLVGHWTPRKGIVTALAAMRDLPPSVTLDLVGDLDRDPRYAARVWAALASPALQGRVRAHGLVPTSTLQRLYRESDALVLPSLHEGYGMVLAEALAAGLPIVATRVGAVPEVVRDGLEAELVAPNDAIALRRAIARLAADPTERERRAAHARERAAGLPTWSASVAAFEGILNRSARVH